MCCLNITFPIALTPVSLGCFHSSNGLLCKTCHVKWPLPHPSFCPRSVALRHHLEKCAFPLRCSCAFSHLGLVAILSKEARLFLHLITAAIRIDGVLKATPVSLATRSYTAAWSPVGPGRSHSLNWQVFTCVLHAGVH